MKKNYLNILLCSLISLGFHSCKDYLDTVPIDKVSPKTFLTNVDQARSLMAGIYNSLYDDGPVYIFPYSFENMSDNSFNPNTWENSAEFAKGTQTSNSWLAEYKWNKNWLGISRANSLIRGVQESELAPADKLSLLAESRFLRAYFYYELLTLYGRLPILDENSPLENPPRQDISNVLTFIGADLTFAADNLPHSFGGQYASQGAAIMLQLKVAQYTDDNEAVVALAPKIRDLGYTLYPDFAKLFLDAGINDKTNQEVIFKINYAKDLKSSYQTMLWYHWNSFHTTLPMVESFFTTNGLPVKDLAIDGGGVISKDPTYNPNLPFTNRDPRLHLSILCPGSEYRLVAQSRYQANWVPASWGNLSGFRPKKGADEYIANTENDGSDKIIMRYAEVLLSWAESENELNGPAAAYPLIDQIRSRVGMIKLSVAMPNLSKAAMRTIIRNERRVELFNEGQRWFDIRRWKIAERVMVDAVGLDVSKMKWYSNGNVTADWQYEPIVIDQRSFNAKRDYLWPIPQKEMNANPEFEGDQNPGY